MRPHVPESERLRFPSLSRMIRRNRLFAARLFMFLALAVVGLLLAFEIFGAVISAVVVAISFCDQIPERYEYLNVMLFTWLTSLVFGWLFYRLARWAKQIGYLGNRIINKQDMAPGWHDFRGGDGMDAHRFHAKISASAARFQAWITRWVWWEALCIWAIELAVFDFIMHKSQIGTLFCILITAYYERLFIFPFIIIAIFTAVACAPRVLRKTPLSRKAIYIAGISGGVLAAIWIPTF